jgi:hypothetical protein
VMVASVVARFESILLVAWSGIVRALLIGLLAACLSGCFGSGEPDDLFFVVGQVRDASGNVLPGVRVQGMRSVTNRCQLHLRDEGSEFEALGFETLASASTDSAGSFLLEYYRFQLEDLGMGVRCMRLLSGGAALGGSTAMTFWATLQDHEVPPLIQWGDGMVRVTPRPPGLELGMPTVLPWETFSRPGEKKGLGWSPRFYEWQVLVDGLPAWRAWADGAPFFVEPEVLEEFGLTHVSMEGLSRESKRPSNPFLNTVEYLVRIQGPLTSVSPTGGVPVSRGAPCIWGGDSIEPCPLTDGKLDLYRLPSSPDDLPVGEETVRLALSRPARLRVMVLRDASLHSIPRPWVEGSVDGNEWFPLYNPEPSERDGSSSAEDATVDYRQLAGFGQFLRIPLDSDAQEVRHVRLRGYRRALSAARELSFFE